MKNDNVFEEMKIALFVDYDNFNKDHYLNALYEDLKEKGKIQINNFYYANIDDKNIKKKAINYGAKLILSTHTTGKNASDLKLAIDAIKYLDRDFINTYCIASSDSDFAPLIIELKENDKYLIGAGNSQTSPDYKKLFNDFLDIESFLKNKNKTSKQKEMKNSEFDELKLIIDEQISKCKIRGDKFVLFSQVIEQIKRQHPDINPKNYGALSNKWTNFFEDYLYEDYEYKRSDTTSLIRKKIKNNNLK